MIPPTTQTAAPATVRADRTAAVPSGTVTATTAATTHWLTKSEITAIAMDSMTTRDGSATYTRSRAIRSTGVRVENFASLVDREYQHDTIADNAVQLRI